MSRGARTHRYCRSGCNTRERVHHWTTQPRAAMRLYVKAQSALAWRRGGWVEDRHGARDYEAAQMGVIAALDRGQWTAAFGPEGEFVVRCVCGFVARSAAEMKQHPIDK